MKTYTPAEVATMTKPQLRAALRPLNLNPKGGLSRATRRELVGWMVMNGLVK